MRYTVGKIAKALGVSTQCVRHYESLGLIETQRNENNNYRTYTTKDVKYLFQTCLYRSFGFSLKEIKSLLSEYDVNEVNQSFNNRINEVDFQIANLMKLRHELVDYQQNFLNAVNNVGKVEIIDDNLSFYLVLKNGHGSGIPGSEDDLLIECEQNAPYIRQAFCVKSDTIYGRDEDVYYMYGVTMSPDFVSDSIDPELLKKHRIEIKGPYARTYFKVHETSCYRKNLINFIEEIEKQGYKAVGELYGVARFVSLYPEETDVYEYIVEVRPK